MWAVLVGFFGGRMLRNSRTPDSVKQQRWDARQARKHPERSWPEHAIGNRGFWPIVLGLTVAIVVVLGAVAVFR